MGRSIEKLSAVTVNKCREPGRLSDGGGLYLSVQQSGSKSWVFMWTTRGKRREMGLGAYPAISLKSARIKAEACRTQVEEGLDPIAEREKNQRKTFGECADLYIETMEGTWKNAKHKYQWRQTLGSADTVRRKISYCEGIRSKAVAEIGTEDVLGVLTPIWSTKPETAARIRSRIELVLDFAKVKGWRDGDNPARWRGHLKNALGARKRLSRGHLAAMAYRDIPTFLERLQRLDAMSARALEFTILTAARTSEVLKAEWTEFDLDKALWTVPAHRMKGGEEHVVPLSASAVQLLRPLYENRISEFVFPGNTSGKNKDKPRAKIGPLSIMAMEMLLRRMDVKDATVHGFRSAFRDWCGDETDVPREVAEAALAHKVGNAVERSYRRGKAIEKRRRLMEAWATYCIPNTTDNVISLNTG
jgi:integrase